MSPWEITDAVAGLVIGFGSMWAGGVVLRRWQRTAARLAVLRAIGGAGEDGMEGDRARVEAWSALAGPRRGNGVAVAGWVDEAMRDLDGEVSCERLVVSFGDGDWSYPWETRRYWLTERGRDVVGSPPGWMGLPGRPTPPTETEALHAIVVVLALGSLVLMGLGLLVGW